MAVIDFDVVDARKAAELLADPAKLEKTLHAYGEQLIMSMQIAGLSSNVEVETLAQAGVAGTSRGLVVTDYDRKIEYMIRLGGEPTVCDVTVTCLKHSGECGCVSVRIARALCRIVNRWVRL